MAHGDRGRVVVNRDSWNEAPVPHRNLLIGVEREVIELVRIGETSRSIVGGIIKALGKWVGRGVGLNSGRRSGLSSRDIGRRPGSSRSCAFGLSRVCGISSVVVRHSGRCLKEKGCD